MAIRHLEFKKISYLVTWVSSICKSAVTYQISSKYDVALRYGNLRIFKMAAIHHLKFLKFEVYAMRRLSSWYYAFKWQVSLKSDNSLPSYGQKTIYNTRPCWIVKIFIFRHDCCRFQSAIVSDHVLLSYGNLTIFKMVAFRHLLFSKFGVKVTTHKNSIGVTTLFCLHI